MQIKPLAVNPMGPATVGWHKAALTVTKKYTGKGDEYWPVEAVILEGPCRGKKVKGQLWGAYDIPRALVATGYLVDDATARTLKDSDYDSMPDLGNVEPEILNGKECWIRVVHKPGKDSVTMFANAAEYSRFAPKGVTPPPASVYQAPAKPTIKVQPLPDTRTPEPWEVEQAEAQQQAQQVKAASDAISDAKFMEQYKTVEDVATGNPAAQCILDKMRNERPHLFQAPPTTPAATDEEAPF